MQPARNSAHGCRVVNATSRATITLPGFRGLLVGCGVGVGLSVGCGGGEAVVDGDGEAVVEGTEPRDASKPPDAMPVPVAHGPLAADGDGCVLTAGEGSGTAEGSGVTAGDADGVGGRSLARGTLDEPPGAGLTDGGDTDASAEGAADGHPVSSGSTGDDGSVVSAVAAADEGEPVVGGAPSVEPLPNRMSRASGATMTSHRTGTIGGRDRTERTRISMTGSEDEALSATGPDVQLRRANCRSVTGPRAG